MSRESSPFLSREEEAELARSNLDFHALFLFNTSMLSQKVHFLYSKFH